MFSISALQRPQQILDAGSSPAKATPSAGENFSTGLLSDYVNAVAGTGIPATIFTVAGVIGELLRPFRLLRLQPFNYHR